MRLSLPTQRQCHRPETGRLRRPSAMQLHSRRPRRGCEQKDQPVICWLIFVRSRSATGRAAQDGRAGACCSFRHCCRGCARFGSTLRVEVISRSNSSFPKAWEGYELRSGQPYACTIAAFANRRYACRAGEIQHLADTHAWHRRSQEAEVRPF